MKNVYTVLLITGLFFMLSACGGGGVGDGGSVDAPADSDIAITVSPDEATITDGSSTTVVDTYYFQIVVKKGDIPLRDVNLSISFPWAVPSPAGAVQLYDGATKVDSPMNVTTDANGAYNLRFDYIRGGGVEYKGDLFVVSGSKSASATFEVALPD
ncbi:MAG: hypothetical protein HZA14_06205 [Nitrospirae bacterium]|nr:hypothetical protein [Nitrospirota bacterium]